MEEVLDKAAWRKWNGGKQRKRRRKRLAGQSDSEVGNAFECGPWPNGDTGGTGRWDSSFRGVPSNDTESMHRSTENGKVGGV